MESEHELLDEIHKRLVQCFLDFVILMELSRRPFSSQDVVTLIDNKHQILLKSDMVSNCLNTLERDGLVKSNANSGKRIFTLTERGKETTRKFLDAKASSLGLLLSLFISE